MPDARKLTQVSYEEMLEMAASGARVLQLRAVEYARNHGIRIHCRSSFEEGMPFVTAFTGIVAAAQTAKAKSERLTSRHFQFSFRSYRSRVLPVRCSEECEEIPAAARYPHWNRLETQGR